MNLKLLILIILFSNILNASSLDNYNLNSAYKSYKSQDYNSSKEYINKIKEPSLQSKIALANIYYKQEKYKQAIGIYKSIKSTSIKIKQLLYYNIANSYAKISKYSNAKKYYIKALQLGEDKDSIHNLKIVALLNDKKEDNLGISKPQSQNSSSNKSDNSSKKDEKKRDNDKSSSGGSGDGKSSKKSNNKKTKLISNNKEEKHPLSSKVYELINEGYIYEKQPW